jgi:hypothetical protein
MTAQQSQLFDKIIARLGALQDLSFNRYVKPEMLEAGKNRNYNEFSDHPFSGRIENSFDYVHDLVIAIDSDNQQQQKELWHILSAGRVTSL